MVFAPPSTPPAFPAKPPFAIARVRDERSDGVAHGHSTASCGGKAAATPCNAARLLLYDVTTDEAKGVDTSATATGNSRLSGICAVDRRVVAAPYNGDQLTVYSLPVVLAPTLERDFVHAGAWCCLAGM